MILESSQSETEMTTKNIPGVKVRLTLKAKIFTAIFEVIV
jgi:hypothetical protein